MTARRTPRAPRRPCLFAIAASSSSPSPARRRPRRPRPRRPRPRSRRRSSCRRIGAPLRVPGSDGMTHLEYDLLLANVFTAPVTLTAVEVLDPDAPPAAPRCCGSRAPPSRRSPSRCPAAGGRRRPRSPPRASWPP